MYKYLSLNRAVNIDDALRNHHGLSFIEERSSMRMRTAAGLCAPTTCATIFPKDSNDVTSSMRTLTIRIQISYVNLLFVVLVSVHRAFNSTDQNGSQQPHIDAPNLRIFSVIHRRFHFRCDIFQVDAVRTSPSHWKMILWQRPCVYVCGMWQRTRHVSGLVRIQIYEF